MVGLHVDGKSDDLQQPDRPGVIRLNVGSQDGGRRQLTVINGMTEQLQQQPSAPMLWCDLDRIQIALLRPIPTRSVFKVTQQLPTVVLCDNQGSWMSEGQHPFLDGEWLAQIGKKGSHDFRVQFPNLFRQIRAANLLTIQCHKMRHGNEIGNLSERSRIRRRRAESIAGTTDAMRALVCIRFRLGCHRTAGCRLDGGEQR